MAQWVAAFMGKSARENYETTLVNGDFWVSSNRTPIRKLRPGDRLLLYMAGEGFVGQAVAFSSAFSYEGRVKSSGKTPVLGVALREIRTFASPIHYKFPEKGPHPALGFHRYALTGGFTALSKEGLQEVLCRAAEQSSPTNELRVGEPGTEARHRTTEILESNPQTTAKRNDKQPESKPREKRQAGQHAVNKGLKGIVLWTVAETVTQAVGWKSAQKKAREKAFNAKNAWLKEGKAETRVGMELEDLREHSFYIFHDVQLLGAGNVDHVALGPHGFFGIETKSHKGRASAGGRELLLNGNRLEKDFISQTWRGCCRLREMLQAEVTPLLCFTDAFVEGRVFVRGVRVLPLGWLNEEILRRDVHYQSQCIAQAVGVLGKATGSYPSSVPRPRGAKVNL